MLLRSNLIRYAHTKARLPQLDFTKPISDRLRKDSSLLKVPLRGQCLFGLYPIELALESKRRQFYRLFLSKTSDENRSIIQKIQHLADNLSIPIQYTDTATLDQLAFDRPHQGVCLDCSPLPIRDINQIQIENNPNKLALDLCLVKIHDPMNLGGIIRTSHFFGIDRLILTRGSCHPSPVASKASSGALELMSLYSCQDLQAYLENLIKQQNVAIICATHQGKISLKTFNLQHVRQQFSNLNLQRILVLIGNEHEGISDEISQLCHYNISIQPNNISQISSLNASVACSLFLYHISAQIDA